MRQNKKTPNKTLENKAFYVSPDCSNMCSSTTGSSVVVTPRVFSKYIILLGILFYVRALCAEHFTNLGLIFGHKSINDKLLFKV